MHSGIVPRLRKSAAPFAFSSVALLLIVAIGHPYHLNTAIVVLLCLSVTVLHALADGFISSVIVSILAGAALEYFFLAPEFSYRVDDPANILLFFLFLIIANGIAWLVSTEYEAWRNSQRQLALAESAAHIGLWSCDLRTRAIVASQEYLRLHGLRADGSPLTWERWLGRVHPDDREGLQRLLQQTPERTHSWETEFRVVWPDGSLRWLLAKGSVSLDDFGRPARMTGVNLDITERKQTEAALRESEERFRNMADAAPVGIWATGPDGLISFCNENALSFMGRTMQQVAGTSGTELIHPEDREGAQSAFLSALTDRRRCEVEYRLRRTDGLYRWILGSGVPRFDMEGVFRGYVGTLIDTTDFKRANEEAMFHQKLESMGRLAGGIAHDFNNLLGGILAGAELALEERADSSRVGEELNRIRLASIRGAEIVRQLMLFGGKESAAFEPVDVSSLVREMLELLKVSISKHTILHAELPTNLPLVHANPAQLRQVVMNLVTNASEAIGERSGEIRVVAAPLRFGADSHQAGTPNLPEGDYLQIDVSDTGSGMTAEVRARIFDPFYTTKLAGRGLGLSVTQGIIRGHSGSINVASEPGRGTTIQVWLPCAKKAAVQQPPNPNSRSSDEPSPAPVGTLLLVEDDEALRRAATRMLRLRGFSVIEASDGSAAIEAVRAHKHELDAMVLDVTLPGISSRDVFEEAKRLRPELKVVLTSAYGQETVNGSFSGLPVEYFIRKPYELDELESLLRGS